MRDCQMSPAKETKSSLRKKVLSDSPRMLSVAVGLRSDDELLLLLLLSANYVVASCMFNVVEVIYTLIHQ